MNFLKLFSKEEKEKIESIVIDVNHDKKIIENLLINNLNYDTLKKIHEKGHKLSYFDYEEMTMLKGIRVSTLEEMKIFKPEDYPCGYFRELFIPISKKIDGLFKQDVLANLKNAVNPKLIKNLEKFKEDPYCLESIDFQTNIYLGCNMFLMKSINAYLTDKKSINYYEVVKDDFLMSKNEKIQSCILSYTYSGRKQSELNDANKKILYKLYDNNHPNYMIENLYYFYDFLKDISKTYQIKLINPFILNLIGSYGSDLLKFKHIGNEIHKQQNLLSPMETNEKIKQLSDKVIEYNINDKTKINLFDFNEKLKKSMKEIDELFDKLEKSQTLTTQEIFYINTYNKNLDEIIDKVKRIDVNFIHEIKKDKKDIITCIEENLYEIKEGLKIIHLTDQKRIMNDLEVSKIYLNGLKQRM